MHKQGLSREAWIGILSGMGGLGVGGYAGMKLERLRGRIKALEGMVRYPEIMIGQLPAKRKKQASYLAKLAAKWEIVGKVPPVRMLQHNIDKAIRKGQQDQMTFLVDTLFKSLERAGEPGRVAAEADLNRYIRGIEKKRAIAKGVAGVGLAALGAYGAYRLLKKKKKGA